MEAMENIYQNRSYPGIKIWYQNLAMHDGIKLVFNNK